MPPWPNLTQRSSMFPCDAKQSFTREEHRETVLLQNRHHSPAAVDANALAVFDFLRSRAGADDRRQSILSRDNRCVAHGAADVGDRRGNLLKHRCPGWIRNMTNQYLAVPDAFDFLHRLHHPCPALSNAA